MADLSKIKLNGTTYNFKDAVARNKLPHIVECAVNLDSTTDAEYIDLGDVTYQDIHDWISDGSLVVLHMPSTGKSYYYAWNDRNELDFLGADEFISVFNNNRGSIQNIDRATSNDIYNALYNSAGRLIPYGYCQTAADTVAKTVTVSPEPPELISGLMIAVKFQYANTGSNPTLNVNGLGAIAIKRYGTTAAGTSAATNWNANSVVILTYDGTYWQLTDFNNTTYSGMTDAEITAGTSTSNRLITPARLKTAIQTWAPSIPTNVSAFTNDAGYLTSYTETDPTVPAWAKQSTKPTYTAQEVGALPADTEIPIIPTNISAFNNDTGYLTSYTETDPTVPAWAKATNKPTYTASEVGALPDTTVIPTVPTNVSDFTNDAGYLTSYTETDPTVPAWAKASSKPTYTAAEVGALPDTTVIPDISGKVDKAGDTMTGDLQFANGKGIVLNYNDNTDRLYLMGYGSNYRVASFEYSTNLRNIRSPDTDTSAVNKAYVDNKATLKTTASSNNTEYNLIGTETSNTNNSAVNIYNPGSISFAKTTNEGRLTLGNGSLPGKLRLYSSTDSASGFTDLISGASSTNERTITLPDATGTVALTSDIPNVPSWALAANKPTYTAAEVGATTSSDVSGMISSAVSGITSFSMEVVSSLPATGVAGRIYFVTGNNNTNDIYEEYIYVNNSWEKLGNFDATNVDLSGYLQTGDIAAWAKAANKPSYTASEVGALSSNTTYVSSFNGESGAITYIPPVTSVNGSTGAVTISVPQPYNASTNPTGYLTISDLPIYDGTVV